MLGELMNIATDTLIDMLYIILAGEVAISASDAREIEQIQRELQRRGREQCWSFQTSTERSVQSIFWMSVEPRRTRTLAEPQSVRKARRRLRKEK
jgi:hypothetical protein